MTLPIAAIPARTHPAISSAGAVLVAALGLFVHAVRHPFTPLVIERAGGRVRTR